MGNTQLPPALQEAQLWPIQAKGAVARIQPLGDPAIEHIYHASLEPGRVLERSIADANNQLLEKKKYIYDKIAAYTRLNSIATNGQLKHHLRALKLAADAAAIVRDINNFQSNVNDVVQALSNNLQTLLTIEATLVNEVNTALASIANLMQQICNWGLPPLASIPNLFPNGLWDWNGFNFSPLTKFANLKPPKLNTSGFQNFSFSQCSLLSVGILPSNPPIVQTDSGLIYGTPSPIRTLPFNGKMQGTPITYTQAQLDSTVAFPIFDPVTFNPNVLLGSVPDPSTIIDAFRLAPADYQANILSLVPATRNLVIEPNDPDYANPDLLLRQPIETKALQLNINLATVVSSNYDPYITSAWLFYLSLNKAGRAGNWLPNFASIFASSIQPSIVSLAANPVPFNNLTGTPNAVPTDIPFVDLTQSLSVSLLQNLLWKLSYVEASLLGYTRNKTWDAAADTLFLSTFTGTDTDYATTPISVAPQLTTVVLGQGTAQFPTPCTFPTSIATVMNQVIALAAVNIQNTPTYLSPHPQYRFIYDQFAQAVMVDRFSQFWREFNNNVVLLLTQDPYILQRVVSYVETLDGAVDPLADQTSYNQIVSDSQARNRAWTPGSDLLNLPIAPIVDFNNPTPPNAGNNGWGGISFNTTAFLQRPDIQSLPIPTQIAMLRTNLSYAGILQYSQQMTTELATQIANAQTAITSVATTGFHVTAVLDTTAIPEGPGVPVQFDGVTGGNNFDITGNVTDLTTFTIQTGGSYALAGQINWDTSAVGVHTVVIMQNGTPMFQLDSPSEAGPLVQQFMTTGSFNAGDVLQVLAYTNLTSSTNVLPGSFFAALLTIPVDGTISGPTPTVSDLVASKTFIAGSNFPALTAVAINGSGDVVPVVVAGWVPNPPFASAPFVDGISVSAGVTGQPVDVVTTFGGLVQFAGAGFTVGGGIYVTTGGALTQTPTSHPNWIDYVGKALTTDTFVFEPHIPQ